MKEQQIENPVKTIQINNAIMIGRIAMLEGKNRIPWQDNDLIETLKAHLEIAPGSASFNELMEAWIMGWDIQNTKSIE